MPLPHRLRKAQDPMAQTLQQALQSTGVRVVGFQREGAQATVALDLSRVTPDTRSVVQHGIVQATAAQTQRALAFGEFIQNRYNPLERAGWYSTFTSDILPFTRAMQLPAQPHDIMKLATELYYTDEIIGAVVNLMVDFSASGLMIEANDPKVKSWFDDWAQDLDLELLVAQIFLEYYRTGNVVIYADVERSAIPERYTLLDPIQCVVEGSLLFGEEEVQVNMNRELLDMVNNPTNPTASTLEALPTSLIQAIRQGTTRVPLPRESVSRITMKRQPYERYATSHLNKIFWPALYKQKLRLMDLSVVEGTTNQILLVKLGSDQFPVDQQTLQRFSTMLQTPQKSFSIVWPHWIEMEFIVPKGLDSVLNGEKYHPINEEILMGLGFPRVLLDGVASGGGGLTNAWVSAMALIERLESGRADVCRWLRQEFRRICEAKGFAEVPRPKFRKINLRSDQTFKNVTLAMYDRGLLSRETVLDEANRSYEVELERKEREQSQAALFVPANLPYYGTPPSGGQNPDQHPPGPPNQGRPPTGEGVNDYAGRGPGDSTKTTYGMRSVATREADALEQEYEHKLADAWNTMQDVLRELDAEDVPRAKK